MKNAKKVFKEWVLPFALEILAIVLVIKFVFFFAYVPTGSMIPTVDGGSWLFSTRMYNPERSVERGDIIVFRSEELNETLLKRCIGLPGEVIELDTQGRLYVNGEPTPEPYVVNTEAMPGRFEVPEGCYLFFGDNRSASMDARYWANPYVPADKLMGEARFTVWPLRNLGPLA